MKQWLKALMAGLVLTLGLGAQAADGIKAVYHMTDGEAQAARGLRNVQNHLNADKTAKIVVVGHGNGINFMLDGAKTPKGGDFAGLISGLASQGVEFRACANTLRARNIEASALVLEAKVVPSGVAEVAMLQAKEGYVYLKP
jgi:intracellular sulfur oxidation DsrE/DsrF family protein